MGKVVFKNANKLEHPVPGVYRWSYHKKSKRWTLYVGQAGARGHGTVIHPSTLGRGVSELQRAAGLSSDSRVKLDTDFVIGTAIRYLKDRGFDCVWEHLSDNPRQERQMCARYKPILQDSAGRIRRDFKLKHPDGHLWNSKEKSHVEYAEKLLHDQFKRSLPT
jgi:hypothetical protein